MSSRVVKHLIDQDTRSTVSYRYRRITRAVNNAFWNLDDENAHSFYVGSYGRGTAIKTSDLDVLIELPLHEFSHFSNLNGNGQSRLLQAVKSSIENTYPNTIIKGDGQIVSVQFSDGMKFEILPAFRNAVYGHLDGTYKYPNTHMGGNWLTTNPQAEIRAIQEKDRECESNKLLSATCQHIRYIRDSYFSSHHLSGILIDSFVYAAIDDWHFTRKGESYVCGIKTYEQHLLDKYNAMSLNGAASPSLRAPGSGMLVDTTFGWTVLGEILNYMA